MSNNVSNRMVSAGIPLALNNLASSTLLLQQSQNALIQSMDRCVSQTAFTSGLSALSSIEGTSKTVSSIIRNNVTTTSQRVILGVNESHSCKLAYTLELYKNLWGLQISLFVLIRQLKSMASGKLNSLVKQTSMKETISGRTSEYANKSVVKVTRQKSIAPAWLESMIAKMERLATVVGKSSTLFLNSVADSISLVSERVKAWASANPAIVKSINSFVAGLTTVKQAITQVKEFIEKIVAPFVALMDLIDVIRKRWSLLKTAFSSGGSLHLITRSFKQLGKGLKGVLRGMTTVGRFAGKLGQLLGRTLLRSINLAGRAVLTLGRALLMNPIGLIITGIATAAYLVYRYWTPISAFFKRLWGQVTQVFTSGWGRIKIVWSGASGWFGKVWGQIKTAFNGGILGVAQLIVRWSPLNLFIKAFSGVMSWFGIDIPKKFSDFGGQLITGLVKGVTQKLSSAKDSIVNFGNSVSGWFKSALGINSPSRIFIGFGDNIAQGAALGIDRTAPQAAKASLNMAKNLMPDIPANKAMTSVAVSQSFRERMKDTRLNSMPSIPNLPVINTAKSQKSGRGNSGISGDIHVNFSPNITMNSKSPTAAGEISGALKLSLRELEKMLEKISNQQNRRGYA